MIARATPLLFAPWVAGCFFVNPAWEPTPNRPPEIVRPDPADGLDEIPLLMDRDTHLTVVASDPEDAALNFIWIVPVDVEYDPTTATEGELWYSVLDIPVDPLLDGQVLEVVVSDGDLEETVSWLVEVP